MNTQKKVAEIDEFCALLNWMQAEYVKRSRNECGAIENGRRRFYLIPQINKLCIHKNVFKLVIFKITGY